MSASASDLILQQNEEYEESLRQDMLLHDEELHTFDEQRIREEAELQEAIKASLSEQADFEKDKPLSPRALREVRMRYFEKKQIEVSNRGIKRRNGINESLILKSKLRSGKGRIV